MKKFLLLALMCTQAVAWDTPDKALSALLDFDRDGGRLNDAGWIKYRDQYLTDLPAGFDEPGWDSITLIASYRLSQADCAGKVCRFTVEYQLAPTAGIQHGGVSTHPEGGVERRRFETVKTPQGWRVRAPQTSAEAMAPHVSLAAFQRHLR